MTATTTTGNSETTVSFKAALIVILMLRIDQMTVMLKGLLVVANPQRFV